MVAPSGQAALANARKVDRYDQGMCLAYVRGEAWKIGALYGSAIDAWYGAVKRHPGDRNPPIGAPMFYGGSTYGHIVIHSDSKPIRGTDMPSPGQVSEGPLDWPEKEWGQTYLGWTEDLNGVKLPLEKDDEMNEDDWNRLRKIVAEEVKKNNNDVAERVWIDDMTVTKPSGEKETKDARQVLREIHQKVNKLEEP